MQITTVCQKEEKPVNLTGYNIGCVLVAGQPRPVLTLHHRLCLLQEENPSSGNPSRMSFDQTCPTRAEESSAWPTRVPTPTSPSCKSSAPPLDESSEELLGFSRNIYSCFFLFVCFLTLGLLGFVALAPPASSHSARAPTWTGSTRCLEGNRPPPSPLFF